MFKYIPLEEQILKERQRNAALEAEARKTAADIDYIAMMTDIDLETEEAEEAQDEEREV